MSKWLDVDGKKKPEDGKEYLVAARGQRVVATYWALTGKWLTADARIPQGVEVEYWCDCLPELPK